LAFWPAIIFAAIAYFVFAKKERNFCFAQMKKLYIIPFLILVLFYGWLLFFKDNFVYDISIFVISVIVGHIAAYYLEISKAKFGRYQTLSIILIILLLAAFSLFTFFPPHNFLFLDPVSGGYGI